MNGDPTITALERTPAGYWRARIESIEVDRRYGSWQFTGPPRRDVMPDAARALQAAVRPLERAERTGVARAAQAERRRRLDAFAAQMRKPADDQDQDDIDAEIVAEEERITAELAAALRGHTLEQILTAPELAWARPC